MGIRELHRYQAELRDQPQVIPIIVISLTEWHLEVDFSVPLWKKLACASLSPLAD